MEDLTIPEQLLVLRTALTKANSQAEHFERLWYLRGDEIEKLQESLADTLYFLERHSNRWDGINGKHPYEVVETARALLSAKEAFK